MRLGQDRRRLLADAVERRAHRRRRRLVLAAAGEPVGELGEERVDLVAVVAAHGVREVGVAEPIERVIGHLRRGYVPEADRTNCSLGRQTTGSAATGFSPE